jgi:hypothetical protein
MSQPRISGTIVCSTRDILRARLGEAGYARLKELLPSGVGESYAMATNIDWLPVSDFNQSYGVAASLLAKPVEELAGEVAREGTLRTMRTVWRVLLRFTTDEALMTRAPLLYTKTFDTGRASTVFETPRRARVSVTGWSMMPALSMLTLGVGIEAVLQAAGRGEAKVRAERSEDGVEYLATW